ncbi:MAG: nicotinamide-nucleotide amidohydrolase family protein [Candidatus Dadabacteria bacterium]|nr:MAG: nicotinamide-nucleotide amidohydrolase family protein [Candidatus Dadabacteria bacterium]
MRDQVQSLYKLLESRGLTIAVAESCTGGLLGGALTSVSGSSRYFLGGVVAYSNHVKKDLLKVAKETISSFGAVSAECAIEMAKGVKALIGSDIGVSITGIAGPEGGTDEKPVGTVFIAVSYLDSISEKKLFEGSRSEIRRQAVQSALLSVIRLLSV